MNGKATFPAFPVNGWQVGAVEDMNGVVIQFGYSTSPYAPGGSTFDSQFFSLTPEKVKSLIYDLQKSLHQYEDKVA
ncbi:phage domain protein [Metakosakonia massiliensis]|uniref:BssS family protein n=1 Tax=Phytobacter massiliensis TaxID=1485952 RepID=A0A6N3HBZ0_9ENTR|nr:phage domain protein [Phytobacter massiliensis]